MTAELVDPDVVSLRMPHDDWTWEDLSRTPEDGHRWEIIDGSLHVSACPTPRHQIAASRLTMLLDAVAPAHLEVTGPIDVQLGDSVLAPDVVVFLADALGGTPPMAADKIVLAVEVVSPSSRKIDRMVKPAILAESGVPAYWRVELDGADAPMVVAYELDGDTYREVACVRAGESVAVDVPFAVELRPAELAGPRRRD